MIEVKENEMFVLNTSKRPYLVYIKYNEFGREYELKFIVEKEK